MNSSLLININSPFSPVNKDKDLSPLICIIAGNISQPGQRASVSVSPNPFILAKDECWELAFMASPSTCRRPLIECTHTHPEPFPPGKALSGVDKWWAHAPPRAEAGGGVAEAGGLWTTSEIDDWPSICLGTLDNDGAPRFAPPT